MDKKLKRYVNEVLRYVNLNTKGRRRLKEDLLTTILEKSAFRTPDDIIREMGSPKELAKEFNEEHGVQNHKYLAKEFEYVSKLKIFGLPLVHITYSKINIRRNIAKGIIAIGPTAIGVIPIGAFSFGIFSIGAISFGLISWASIAIGLLYAVGSIAIGLEALGAVAIGYIARGEFAIGYTAIGEEAFGTNVLIGENISNSSIFEFIKVHHPKLKDWIIRLVSFF